MNTHIIIVAAGTGSRFGADVPKQFCILAGRPVLMHAIERFRRYLPEAGITLVVSESMHEYWLELCERYGFESPEVVHGGATRSDSVRNAVLSLGYEPDVIMVHDGARPLVAASVVAGVLAAMECEEVCGAIPAVAVTDSLRYGSDASVTKADGGCVSAVAKLSGRLSGGYRDTFERSADAISYEQQRKSQREER